MISSDDGAPLSFRDSSERCTVCHNDATGEFNGEHYCDTHLQERMARETGVGY